MGSSPLGAFQPMNRDSHAAFWEFSGRIITPTIERLIRKPSTAQAAEIGFGDGRLLCAAASFFGSVTGVGLDDVDDEATAAEETRACSADVRFEQANENRLLPFEDESLDFIYSLNGIIRLPDLAAFESLVLEISRVLKPGCAAMLWFGRMSRLPFAPPGVTWWRGWARRPLSGGSEQEVLHLRMFHARRAVLRAGMKAVSLSTPMHPDTSWRLLRGGPMSYITAWKPD